MKLADLADSDKFHPHKLFRSLLYDSPNMRILNFNFEPGQELPVHCHDVDADVALLLLEGEGTFTGGQEPIPAKAGMLQIMPVSHTHGFRAQTRARLLVFIAPTL